MSKHPISIPIALFLIALFLRILDIFVFRLDESLGEIILSKLLGFGLVIAYVWMAGRKLSDIGFHKRELSKSLLLGGLTVGGLFALSYGIQLIALASNGQPAKITFSAIDPKTGMAGGLLFAIWLVFGNIVNAVMEEGLFRGVMLTHFCIKLSSLKAISFQALLFASWHLVWPIKHYLTGEVAANEALFEAFGLMISTGIGGLVFGYLYYKTDNLWSAVLAHFINNTILNIVFIQTSEGLQSGVEFGLFIAVWLVGYLALLPLISWLSKKTNLPEFTVWAE